MGRYNGIVLCCDIDCTFIDDKMQIPKANLDALSYFRSEGGKFTVCSGRTLQGAKYYLDRLKTDVPMICQNGSAIYDLETEKFLWLDPLSESIKELITFVEERFPDMGIEIMTPRRIYYYRESYGTYLHQKNEELTVIKEDFRKIPFPWAKVVFADRPENIDVLQTFLEKTEFYTQFKLIRSHTIFYEVVNKTTNKGVALEKLRRLLNLDYKNIFVAGDNENDIDMLCSPAFSFAPSNAASSAKSASNIVLESDNNKGILPEMLKYIDNRLQ